MPVSSAESQQSARRLLSVLGVTFGLAITIGDTIGAGILRTPGEVAARLPSFWLFLSVWVVVGLYALLGANALAELGTLMPRSGGQYVFVRRALGDYAGFVVGWSDWISTSGTTAAVSIVIGEYMVVLFPKARDIQLVALAVVGILTAIQWRGVRWGGSAQNVTSLLKAVALLVFVAACFYLGTRNPAASAMHVEVEGSMLLAFVISLQAVIYTYDGWSGAIYFSEEFREPGRQIPRSMFGGIGAVIVIYLLINIAFLRVLPLASIAGRNLAAGVVAQHLFGVYGDTIVRSLTIVALLSAVNSNVMMAPVLFAMSRDRLFWHGAAEVNAGGTPGVALLISTILSVIFIVTGTFEAVIAKLAFCFVANYSLSFTSLFVLRRTAPDAPRPWRAWGHPVTTGLALAASLGFLTSAVIGDTKNSLWSLGFLALSWPVYWGVKKMRR